MNELEIKVNQKPGVIVTNFEEIKNELSAQMEVYKELEVTEENKTERKKDVATLNKMVKAVNSKRIEVKKECLKPYDEFEKLSSELIAIITEPIGIIDSQVKEFEDTQRKAKIEEINKIFDSLIAEYPTLTEEIGIVNIYDSKWENIGTTLKTVKAEITDKLNTIRDNVTMINDIVSDRTQEALKLFWGDLDVMKAVSMINRYEKEKKEYAEKMTEQMQKEKDDAINREVERAKREERDKVLAEEKAKQDKLIAEENARREVIAIQEAKEKAELEAMTVKRQTEEAESRMYFIKATEEEFEQVEMYLNSLGISFER